MSRLLTCILVLTLLSAHVCDGQNMVLGETEFSFGNIPELGGAVTHRFEYTNTGDKPLIVNTVQTSCGCTSPAWSKEPILPEKTGYIDVTFDPRDRPGAFTKSIIVNSNASVPSVTLYISGEVVPRPEPISAEFPYTMYDLRLKATTVNFNSVLFNNSASHDIEVLNPTKANIKVEVDRSKVPDYITITPKPSVLKPGERGVIRCQFFPQKYGVYDYIQFQAPILVNTYSYNLHFKAFVTEEFSQKDRAVAPVLKLGCDKNVDLGNFQEGEAATYSISFTNTGKSALKIRAVRNACAWLSYKVVTEEVLPGQKGRIDIVVDTEGHPGAQNRYVTIVTNSPETQNVVIKFHLNVTKL